MQHFSLQGFHQDNIIVNNRLHIQTKTTVYMISISTPVNLLHDIRTSPYHLLQLHSLYDGPQFLSCSTTKLALLIFLCSVFGCSTKLLPTHTYSIPVAVKLMCWWIPDSLLPQRKMMVVQPASLHSAVNCEYFINLILWSAWTPKRLWALWPAVNMVHSLVNLMKCLSAVG